MTLATYALGGARVVRALSAGLALSVLVAVVALQAFQAEYGRPTARVATRADVESPQLSAAIAQQGALGRQCSNRPSLADAILFQANGQDEIRVVTFDEALLASSARSGWIRRYCT